MPENLSQPSPATHESTLTPRDFSGALIFALEHAPIYDPNLGALTSHGGRDPSRDAWWEVARAEADEAVLDLGESVESPSVIVVDNPDDYRELLRQSFGLPVDRRGPEDIEQAAATAFAHELEHAEMAARLRPETPVTYALSVFWSQNPDGTFYGSMTPSIKMEGKIRKIDFAMITAAPTTLSEGDIGFLQSLGFYSPEVVADRYAAATRINN